MRNVFSLALCLVIFSAATIARASTPAVQGFRTYYVSANAKPGHHGTSWNDAWRPQDINYKEFKGKGSLGQIILLDGGPAGGTMVYPPIIQPPYTAWNNNINDFLYTFYARCMDPKHNGRIVIKPTTPAEAAGAGIDCSGGTMSWVLGGNPDSTGRPMFEVTGFNYGIKTGSGAQIDCVEIDHCGVGVDFNDGSYIYHSIIHDNSTQVRLNSTSLYNMTHAYKDVIASGANWPLTYTTQNERQIINSLLYNTLPVIADGIDMSGDTEGGELWIVQSIIGPGFRYGANASDGLSALGVQDSLFNNASLANYVIGSKTNSDQNFSSVIYNSTLFSTALNAQGLAHSNILSPVVSNGLWVSNSVVLGGMISVPLKGMTNPAIAYGLANGQNLQNVQFDVTGNQTFLANSQINPFLVTDPAKVSNTASFQSQMNFDFSKTSKSPAIIKSNSVGVDPTLTSIATFMRSVMAPYDGKGLLPSN